MLRQSTVLTATSDVPKPVGENSVFGGGGDSGPAACAGGDAAAPGTCPVRRLQAHDMCRMTFKL